MKKLLPVFCAFCLVFSARAGIVGTNLFNLATYAAATNASITFVPPQTHNIVPQTFTFYHSVTNASFPTTNILQVTFDGGVTWANVATYVDSTNVQNETWTIPSTTLTASNRILTINYTNQTLFSQANWIQ